MKLRFMPSPACGTAIAVYRRPSLVSVLFVIQPLWPNISPKRFFSRLLSSDDKFVVGHGAGTASSEPIRRSHLLAAERR